MKTLLCPYIDVDPKIRGRIFGVVSRPQGRDAVNRGIVFLTRSLYPGHDRKVVLEVSWRLSSLEICTRALRGELTVKLGVCDLAYAGTLGRYHSPSRPGIVNVRYRATAIQVQVPDLL
jgi:hypothetical protein